MKKTAYQVCLLFLALVIAGLPFSAFASCANPTIIYSATNGNFNAAATWAGNVIPTSCDVVVIRHNVTLNQSFMVGNNGNIPATLIIESNGSLIGTGNALSISLNSVVNNHGVLQIAGLNFWGNYATFRNYGTAVLSNSIAANALSQIQNYASLTLNNGLDQNGNTFINFSGGVTTIKGELKLQNSTIEALLQNYGAITVEKQVTVNNGALINEPTGRLYMLGNLLVNSGSGRNRIDNKGTLAIGQDFKTNPVSYVYNSNTMTVGRDLDNRSAFENEGGTVDVSRNFLQGNQQSAKFMNNNGGLVTIYNDFWNDGLISGDKGMYVIKGISTITANGKFQGDIDICDQSKTSGDIDNLNPQSKVGSDVTYCSASRFLGPLPVTLLNFSAISNNGKTTLKWQTAQEKNSDKFIVERSSDGKSFEAVGSIKAAGYSNDLQTYRFEDKVAYSGTAYYRLKQVDADQSFEYSAIIAVEQKALALPVNVYPQPVAAGQPLFVQLQNPEAIGIKAELTSVEGAKIKLQDFGLIKSNGLLEVALPNLKPGIYLLQIYSPSQQPLFHGKVLIN